MMSRLLLAPALAFAVALSAPAGAQTEILFSTPHLEETASNSTLVYHWTSHFRDGTTGDIAERTETVKLAIGASPDIGARPLEVTMISDGHERRIDSFTGVPGNPVLMVFLEGMVRSIQKATGGSPFYLRNRIKDALRDGLTVSTDKNGVETLTMRPFETDRNRARMGPFAMTEVQFVVDRSAPGMLLRMVADTGGPRDQAVYYEEVVFDETL